MTRNVEEMKLLCYMLSEGEGCEINLAKSFDCYSKAAKKGDTDAIETLSFFIRDGYSVEIKMFVSTKGKAEAGDIHNTRNLARY
jgi:TPR repeat protein